MPSIRKGPLARYTVLDLTRTAAPDRGAQSEGILREYGYAENEIADFRQREMIRPCPKS